MAAGRDDLLVEVTALISMSILHGREDSNVVGLYTRLNVLIDQDHVAIWVRYHKAGRAGGGFVGFSH